MTASPLSLGTLYKRGNYDGIWIANNAAWGAGVAPGADSKFAMTSGGDGTQWTRIRGYAYTKAYTSTGGQYKFQPGSPEYDFDWGRFIVHRDRLGVDRHYRVPTYEEYSDLLKGEYGVGVVYGDGATETAENVNDAYGFEDWDNDGKDNNLSGTTTRGMRGIIVYNPKNAHQLFFPIGGRGMGRRTITGFTETSWANFGTLRYGGVDHCLTQYQNVSSAGISNNQYRPIPYNMPAAPGAIYWFNQLESLNSGVYLGWDMNYFDNNFNAYDYGISRSFSNSGNDKYQDTNYEYGGDALPIKVVLE
ncbi:MAG: hypothetical protein NC349_04960 [Paenibacillus sp.]|nr:hypothetical protein [Paenibacillus sp.]